MIGIAVGAVVAAVGAFLGLSIPRALKRRAPTAKEGARRSQLFIGCVMLVCAALEVFIVITGASHPYVNIAVAALFVITAIMLLIRNLPRNRNATNGIGERG